MTSGKDKITRNDTMEDEIRADNMVFCGTFPLYMYICGLDFVIIC